MTSRRQAVLALTFQVEQLLKQSSSELTVEQTEDLEALIDDVRHRLNTVSIVLSLLYFVTYLSYKSRAHFISTTSPVLNDLNVLPF